MQQHEALEVLKTDDALQKKLSGAQFFALFAGAVIAPLIVLMVMGAWF